MAHSTATGVEEWLAWVPSKGFECPKLRITAGQLLRAARKCLAKAAGPDLWSAKQLVLLPQLL